MRAITVILHVCLILGNFIQPAELSDRHGAIGKNVKQKSMYKSIYELIFSVQIGFVSATVFHAKTLLQNDCVSSRY